MTPAPYNALLVLKAAHFGGKHVRHVAYHVDDTHVEVR